MGMGGQHIDWGWLPVPCESPGKTTVSVISERHPVLKPTSVSQVKQHCRSKHCQMLGCCQGFWDKPGCWLAEAARSFWCDSLGYCQCCACHWFYPSFCEMGKQTLQLKFCGHRGEVTFAGHNVAMSFPDGIMRALHCNLFMVSFFVQINHSLPKH